MQAVSTAKDAKERKGKSAADQRGSTLIEDIQCSHMPFRYQLGEEIRSGDNVTFHGEPGTIEFVADPQAPTPDTDWYVREFGGGVM